MSTDKNLVANKIQTNVHDVVIPSPQASDLEFTNTKLAVQENQKPEPEDAKPMATNQKPNVQSPLPQTLVAQPSMAYKLKKKRLEGSQKVANKIFTMRFNDAITKFSKDHKFAFTVIPEAFMNAQSMDDHNAILILNLVSKDLKKEGLWNDEYKDVCFTEAFPLSQVKNEVRFSGLTSNQIDRGTFLEEDDLTDQDTLGGDVISDNGPVAYARPMIYNLMRPQPLSLYHAIARRMIDTNYFQDHPDEIKYFRSCFLYAKNIETEIQFDSMFMTSMKIQKFEFSTYQAEILPLRRKIKILIKEFFVQNPAIVNALNTRSDDFEKADPREVWPRYFKVWDNLSTKQRTALEKIYMQAEPDTYASAAESLQISKDSLRDRLSGAIQKFTDEFPEFKLLKTKSLPRSALTCDLHCNGLWRKSSAEKVHKLFAIDPMSGAKTEISNATKPVAKKLKPYEIAKIKAWVYESTPVPYFHETDFFLGLTPGVTSVAVTTEDDKDQESAD